MSINHQTSQSATGRRAPLSGHTLAPNTNLKDRQSETVRPPSVLGLQQIPDSIWPVATENTEARLHSDRGPASILVEPTRTPRETRAIAIALSRNPLPSFPKADWLASSTVSARRSKPLSAGAPRTLSHAHDPAEFPSLRGGEARPSIDRMTAPEADFDPDILSDLVQGPDTLFASKRPSSPDLAVFGVDFRRIVP
ncbi:hypothetical protein [Leisingera sp. F5]|uniref:hypothetical protein n=1 Tax=Leisingera sp. F5 TaxID=1813816 RepID=UPI000A9453F4|nr:hypothetical protein [Leisingera sp. F5]